MSDKESKPNIKLTPNPVNDHSLAIEKAQKEQMVKR